ncbi:MAG: S8 family serine peptidase [Bacteroidia bacterium]
MKKILFLFSLILAFQISSAQDTYWVFFKDKGNLSLLESPGAFLGTEALQKRAEKHIPIEISDLPVEKKYINGLKAAGFDVISSSRWMNAAVVRMACDRREEVLSLGFVEGVKPTAKMRQTSYDAQEQGTAIMPYSPLLYGQAEEQNSMLNIASLHDRGFTGRGVKMAVLDAGFRGADTISAFDSMRSENRILATWDFVDNDESVYHSDAHGTQVLSVIAANLPGVLVGTAPHVSVILLRTENSRSETRQEEYNWVKAVEMADSMGVDIIHSSLGYSEFDDDEGSYKYEDLNGNTAITTRAADMAAAKGMLITVSAGNEGDNDGITLLHPAMLTAFYVWDRSIVIRIFPDFLLLAPSADGRVKPDVVAMGSRTMAANPNNRIYGVNGTRLFQVP